MKFTRILFMALALVSAVAMQAQDKKPISKIKKGTVLKSTDILFLGMVTNADFTNDKNAKKVVTIGGQDYKEGSKLTKADATAITGAITEWRKSNQGVKDIKDDNSPGNRGAGWCYYWAYYWDYYCGCYVYYKVWYYC
ncbi:MAG TPA: hypothetical protein VFV31_02750 [Chitinophagaceae bacterium]|nr:hypothetical protein [Chitinophagaceae bacterium]